MARFASISSLEQADLWRRQDAPAEAKGLEQRANEMPLRRPLDKRYDMVNIDPKWDFQDEFVDKVLMYRIIRVMVV